ncbi:isoflavone reductase family protein [Grosmannia clavigera kw1407]|uniref:Isoflavone reductase family protein n=1 Tax=Grosmannia clavigera (strain kw1407 / UAMH 11150) TaxID=655863 RepID=F0XR45_GROCL|nr:isoflavone reductase family protein [Grosmannia clavigera kw1407]EFW99959.1 isoflavone reductase family protein [Grosmannia clavigera kw1407]
MQTASIKAYSSSHWTTDDPTLCQASIVGAAGETGTSIIHGLLESSTTQFEITALTRPSSLTKTKNVELERRGVKLVAADFAGPEAELVRLLDGIEAVVVAVDPHNFGLQIPLANAAKAAGVQRFVPCTFATVAPPKGVMQLREMKEDVINHMKKIYLPYTVIDVGWWFQLSIPSLPSGRTQYAISMSGDVIAGDGTVRSALTDMRDVGRYAARIIADARTLNRMVFAYGEVRSQNDVFGLLEKISGETIERTHANVWQISEAAILANIEKAQASSDPKSAQTLWLAQYMHSWGIRGDNTPEHARYLGYLDGKELYPDFQAGTLEAFLTEILDGRARAVYNMEANGNDSSPLPVPYSVFSRRTRTFLTYLLGVITVLSTLTSTIYFPLLPLLSRQLKVSAQAINLTVTAYSVAQAVSPAFFASLADARGRRPILLMLVGLYAAASLGLVFAQRQRSYAALLVLRVVQSLGGSPLPALAYGIVADVALPAERGRLLGPLQSTCNAISAVGPVVGGAVARVTAGALWVFVLLAVLAAALLLLAGLSLPETARSIVGNGSEQPVSVWWRTPWRPANAITSFRILFYPDAAAVLWTVAAPYAVYYTMQVAIPTIFADIYGYDELQIGLVFLPGLAGMTIGGLVAGRLVDRNYAKMASEHGIEIEMTIDRSQAQAELMHFPIEAARYRHALVFVVVMAVLVCGYGWAVQVRVHPAVLLVLQALICASSMLLGHTASTLLVDIFPGEASSAYAAGQIVRCGLGAASAAVLQPLVQAMGYGWYFVSLAAVVGLAAALSVVVSRWKGMAWRQRRGGNGGRDEREDGLPSEEVKVCISRQTPETATSRRQSLDHSRPPDKTKDGMEAHAPNTAQHLVDTARGQYLVQVSWPLDWTADGNPNGTSIDNVPVIYCVDGNVFFFTATDIVRRLQYFADKRAIVVGIGYPLRHAVYADRRKADLTPPSLVRQPEDVLGRDGRPLPDVHHGEAEAFLDVLVEVIVPFVAVHVLPAVPLCRLRQVLFGHSFGGLFALYALFTRPHRFDTVVAASPSIWWNGASIVHEQERAFRDGPAPARKPHLYLTYGTYEQHPPRRPADSDEQYEQRKQLAAGYRMVDNTVEMKNRLQTSNRLETVWMQEFTTEDHGGASVTGLQRGIMRLLGEF